MTVQLASSNISTSKPKGVDADRLSICMFSNLYPPIVSGSSTFTWEFSRRLAARNHRVVVVTAKVNQNPSYEEQEGVIIHRLPAFRLPRLPLAHNFEWMTFTFTPRNYQWLKQLFDREQFDIVHQQNHVFDTILLSPLLARRYRLPLFLTVHTFVQHPNKLFNSILSVLDALARKVIFEKADQVISPDPSVQKYVAVRHRISSSPLIPYGIEIPAPNPEDIQALRQRYNLISDDPVIVSVGHINPIRDRADLVQAMPRILEKFPKARLLIVGSVNVNTPVRLAQQLGLDSQIIFTGALPHNQVAALLAMSKMEVHTVNSQYPGPGIASMEAMAAGLPVITGEIDKQYDFKQLQNWENVIMVPPNQPDKLAEAALRLLADESLRQRIGINARRVMAEFYSWEAVCSAYEGLYRQAISTRLSQENK